MSSTKIKFTPVVSSNITSFATDGTSMLIKFNSGNVYKFAQVPTSVVEGFVAAESKGKYFASSIRSKFDTTKVVL